MGLTKQEIDRARFDPNGPSWQWLQDEGDKGIAGFGLRLLPSGRKSFVLRYYNREGRRRYMTLGAYGVLTVTEARQRAKVELGRALDGKDPGAERREARQGATLREFAPVYVRRMAKRWTEKTKYEYQRRIDRHLLPAFGAVPVDAIKRADVATLIDRIAQNSGPTEANRVHEIIRAMFNRAVVWGYVPDEKPNPARLIERFKERPRDRWLKPEEVERLMQEVAKQPDPYFRAFVPLLLLTGMRKSELLGAQWEHIHFVRGEILLPKTKAGKPQTRKLSVPALQILRFIPRELIRKEPGDESEPTENAHVFPARGTKSEPGAHRLDFKREWVEVRTAAGLEGVTIHDLRRTAGSYMAQAGVSLQVIGEVLGHQGTAVTKVYARLAEENERHALDALGEKIQGLMVGTGDAT